MTCKIATAELGTTALKAVPRAALTVALMVSMSGCGHSPPIRYVTLSSETAGASRVAPRMQPVQLTAVHIPAVLDRPEVVTQASANQLTVHDADRWGAPLGQMMRRTLAQDLLARLPVGSFILPDAPAPPGTRSLVVTVLSAEPDTSGTLTMQVAWTLLAGNPSRAVLTQQAALASGMANADATAQAAAMSHILGQLADRITTSIAER